MSDAVPKHASPVSTGEAAPGDALPAPVDPTGVASVTIGTGLFGLAFVALIPFYGRLQDAGNGWMLWSALTGFGLGCLGIEYVRRRARRLQKSTRSSV